jgi:hypothetical protein
VLGEALVRVVDPADERGHRRAERHPADGEGHQVVGRELEPLGDELRHDAAPVAVAQHRMRLERRNRRDERQPDAQLGQLLGVVLVRGDDGARQRVHQRLVRVGRVELVPEPIVVSSNPCCANSARAMCPTVSWLVAGGRPRPGRYLALGAVFLVATSRA